VGIMIMKTEISVKNEIKSKLIFQLNLNKEKCCYTKSVGRGRAGAG